LTMAQTRGKKSLLRLTNSTAKHLTDFCCKLLFLFLLLLLLLSLHLHFHLPTAAQFAFAQVEERWHRTCISMTIFPFAIFRLPRVQCSPVARDGQRYGNYILNLICYTYYRYEIGLWTQYDEIILFISHSDFNVCLMGFNLLG